MRKEFKTCSIGSCVPRPRLFGGFFAFHDIQYSTGTVQITTIMSYLGLLTQEGMLKAKFKLLTLRSLDFKNSYKFK